MRVPQCRSISRPRRACGVGGSYGFGAGLLARPGRLGSGPSRGQDAAKHPEACCEKCAKGGSALTLVSGDKTYKLDDASKAKAMDYLASEKGEGATRVAVEGTLKDDTLTISSIKKAEKKEG